MAFPTTGILDTFDRANTSDLGADWTPNPFNNSGDKRFGIFSNATEHVAEAYAAEWYHAATYGPNVEAYITVVARPSGAFSSDRLDVRLANPSAGAATADSYRVRAMSANNDGDWVLARVDDTVETQLGATMSQSWASGDSIGLEATGTTINAYHKPAAGSWALVGTRTDSTYTAAGLLAMHENDSGATGRLDDFGGGTFVSTDQTLRPSADVTTTGWTTTPLWSKIDEATPDGTIITATAS